jgi:hypothetical protein
MDIVKDFLEKGKIKMDNGIPLPLEKLETTPYKKYKISIDAHIDQ